MYLCFSLISQISPDAPKQTFMNVAKEIFSDGVYNWGRIVALFYFAYKMVVKVYVIIIHYNLFVVPG